ncbi:MAG: GIY-YIG nuclease family protein [Candidatus Acidiferrales bacterium]
MKGGFVYILASKSGVLYTGVTSNLDLRTVQHRLKMTEGFTKEFNVTRLVYYERFGDIRQAIAREKQIKGWLRAKKIALIEAANPKWKDLAEDHFPAKPADPPPS